MLRFDAKDHQFVNAFYQLKPRKTEIKSAKIIWKTIHDEQTLQYEIALFKNWLSSPNRSTTCTFQDLELIKINHIFTHLIFDKNIFSTSFDLTNHETISIVKFIKDLTEETIYTAEKITQGYQQKVNDEKQKILNNKNKFKKPPSVESIITAIENRQMNMIQRAQCNTEQQIKSLYQRTIIDNSLSH